MTPHSRPSTLTGTPTAARRPARGRRRRTRPRRRRSRRSVLAGRSGTPAWTRSARRGAAGGRSGQRGPVLVHAPTTVAAPSGSYRRMRRDVGVQQPPGLLGDRGEHLLRRRRPWPPAWPPGAARPARRRTRAVPSGPGRWRSRCGQLGEPGQPGLGARGSGLALDHAHDAPQPAPDGDRRADRRADPRLAGDVRGLTGRPRRSRRSAPPAVSKTSVASSARRGASRVPTAKGTAAPLAHAPTATAVPSGSYRPIAVSRRQHPPGLRGDRGEHLLDGAARATSVATRRSAACSAAKPRSSTRAWAFAIAVAASSVNPASRASVSVGSGCSRVDTRTITPHRRPSTLTGAPTAARTPNSRATSAAAPETPTYSSRRAALARLEHQRDARCARQAHPVPTGTAAPVLPHAATTLAAPPGSYGSSTRGRRQAAARPPR